jgi:hypothetical protein
MLIKTSQKTGIYFFTLTDLKFFNDLLSLKIFLKDNQLQYLLCQAWYKVLYLHHLSKSQNNPMKKILFPLYTRELTFSILLWTNSYKGQIQHSAVHDCSAL